ncbi:hypothetical protein M9H77_18748 [Catharanthus roseus]|uniref:Uncharacterized protein n=1 Tax=Catharanthus roseus TaxID=4058 RepID=A0ACC0B8B6_CATRO|nr:hypothetical protein M9H77_18748 [Catharanthus roseus]
MHQMKGDMGIIPETEVVDNFEVIFPSWSIRMKRRKTSTRKDKEVKEAKTMLSGGEQQSRKVASEDGVAIRAEKKTGDGKHMEMKADGTQNTKVGKEVTSPHGKKKSISPNGKEKNSN